MYGCVDFIEFFSKFFITFLFVCGDCFFPFEACWHAGSSDIRQENDDVFNPTLNQTALVNFFRTMIAHLQVAAPRMRYIVDEQK